MKNNIQNYLDRNKISNTNPSTQDQLAELVGVKREYINRIVNGNITPMVPLAMRIKDALGAEKMEDVFILDKIKT